jgi:hypothetical protein
VTDDDINVTYPSVAEQIAAEQAREAAEQVRRLADADELVAVMRKADAEIAAQDARVETRARRLRTVRDYALRVVTFLAVCVLASVGALIAIYLTAMALRAMWLDAVVANAATIAIALVIVFVVLWFALAIRINVWRKDFLWRRFWIDVGR